MEKKYETKTSHPDPRIAAYQQLLNLKGLYRQGWLQNDIPKDTCETVADHSFGTALLAMLLCPSHLDAHKVVQMALIHEAGECVIGDITPRDEITAASKRQQEEAAVMQLFAKLPQGDEWLALWREFEYGTSQEGRFVQQLDKLEMGLQAQMYETLLKRDFRDFVTSAQKTVQNPVLQEILMDKKK